MISKELTIVAGILFTAVGASAAYAQNSAAATTEPSSGTAASLGSQQLEEVIVTAQRRAENLQKTPIAVTAYSAEDLIQQDVRTARDLVGTTPNLQLIRPPGTDPNFVEFAIRGFDIVRPLLGVQQPVGVYIDDYYYPSLSGSLLRVADLQSVEVLRGPQGTLFGQNSLGGAVRYNTTQPNGDFGGHVDVTFGTLDRKDYSGAINLPILGDALAVRLTGASLEQNGYVKDVTTGLPVGNSDDKIARIQIRAKPIDNLIDDLTAEDVKSDFSGDGQVVTAIDTMGPFVDPLAQNALRANAATDGGGVVNNGHGTLFPTTLVPNFYNLFKPPGLPAYGNEYVAACRYCSSGTTNPEFSDTTSKDLRNTLAWSPSSAVTVKSLSGYFDVANGSYIDTDRTPIDVSDTLSTIHVKAFSQELQAGGLLFDDRLTYTGGLYYYHFVEDDVTDNGGFGAPAQLAVATDTRTSRAAYLQVSYKITPDLTATVGGRETHEHVRVVSIAGNPDPTNPPGPDPYASLPPVANSVTVTPPAADYRGFTPTYKLQYQFTPDLMVYASASKGFRGGTINTLTSASYYLMHDSGLTRVNPDTAWSYEIGARTEFFDRHLMLNVTAFDAYYKNIQLLLVLPPPPGPPVPETILANVGNAQMYGVEVEAQAVFGQLRLHGNVSTLDTHYTSIDANEAESGITTHSYFEHAPRLTYDVGASYNLVLPVGNLDANLDYGWQDTQVAGNQDHISEFMPSYGLLNGRLAYNVNSHVTASLEARNILDKFYIINESNTRYYTGLDYYEPGEPRTVAGTVRYNF